MGESRKVVTPDLEKSFSKQTQGMKSIVVRAIQQGAIRRITNPSGNSIDVSRLPPKP